MGYGNETCGVLRRRKEINENQTTCKCSNFLSMERNFCTSSTRQYIYFFFSNIKLTLTKSMKNTINA